MKKIKSFPGRSALLIGLTVLLIGLGQSARADEIVARMAFHWAPTHPGAIHAQMFADEVNRRAEGRLKIEVYPTGQLFGVREMMGAVTAGSVEIGGILGVVSFPPINKNYNVAVFSGLFDSFDQQRAFFKQDAAGRALWANLTQKTRSVRLMYNPVGPVMTFSSKRELNSVAAMKGLKARALVGSERPRWKVLEANYVSLPTGEVYTALQSGLINTLNSPPSSIRAYSWWEFLKYGQLPYQYFADAYMMANADWFNGLPADLQQTLLQAGEAVGKQATDSILATGAETLAAFKQRGGVVTTLSGSVKAEFDQLMEQKVLPEMRELVDIEVFRAAQAFTGN